MAKKTAISDNESLSYIPFNRPPLANDPFDLLRAQWEYCAISGTSPLDLIQGLNAHGAEGWEAISVGGFQGAAYMKRRKA